MREKQRALVVTFSMTTEALAAERFCQLQGLPGRMIPVPLAITAGCGLAWKALPQQRERLLAAWTEAGLRWATMVELDL
jgi:hypothetical protein